MDGKPQSATVVGGALARELYGQSGAGQYGLTEAEFARVLAEVAAKYLPAEATENETARLLRSLRLEELGLARACAAGSERAWEVFLARYRARLYEMAGAIARDDASARELADSLYGELYGVSDRDGQRVPKLNFYLGRGSLEGWLRAVLAQGFVDRCRRQKRLVSLEQQEEGGTQLAAAQADPPPAVDPRVEQATDAALAALRAEERFLLASYFLDGRRLAEIARMLGVHESTVSRKLDKLTCGLRDAIIKRLLAQGMSRRQAEEALEADVRDLRIEVRARLHPSTAASAVPGAPLAQGTAGAAFNSGDEKT